MRQYSVIQCFLLILLLCPNTFAETLSPQRLLDEELITATMNGSLPDVKKALGKGANINFSTTRGVTILAMAASKDHTEIAEFLIKNNANVNINSLPLCTAIVNANSKLMKIFLDAGAKCDIQRGFHSENYPLHYATTPEVIDLLISKGAKINAIGDNGNTALHLKVIQKEYDAVRHLKKLGADLQILNKDQKKPIDLATDETTRELLK